MQSIFLLFLIFTFFFTSFCCQELFSMNAWISWNNISYEIAQLEKLAPEDMGNDYEILDMNGDNTILVIVKDGKLYVVELP